MRSLCPIIYGFSRLLFLTSSRRKLINGAPEITCYATIKPHSHLPSIFTIPSKISGFYLFTHLIPLLPRPNAMVEEVNKYCMEKRISSSQDQAEVRKGPWTMEEDLILINYISNHGEGVWNTLAKSAGLKRTGKSCRLRWLNYLRPDVRRGNITPEEQFLIMELHSRWGNRWSKIARQLPGRTDNEIKNYWRTRIQRKSKQCESLDQTRMMMMDDASTSHSNGGIEVDGMATQPSYQLHPNNPHTDAFAAAPSFPTDSVENFWTVEDFWTMQPINGD